jgi:EAL domain-containing protein (putative c-di-GMP-specific phosphodiesterase class I)
MLAGGLGNIRAEHVKKGKIVAGAKLIVLGGPAMLIGLGGGAASSMASGSGQEDLDFASVQRDNAEMERRCQEVIDRCWALGEANPISFIHDVGAGGLSNALPELVNDGGRGGRFNLRAVPNDEPGMSPLEIWCNESQERYVLAIAPEARELFADLCARERCPWAVVGTVTDDGQLIVRADDGSRPVDMPIDVLLGKPPRMHRSARRRVRELPPVDCVGLELAEELKREIRGQRGLTASIGIAVYPQDGRDQQSLLKHADIAMYRAKEKGKNCFELYSSGMNATSMDRLSLELRLKRAVTEQNQFVLHYQPKISVADGRIVGVEALVRWMSPDHGLVPPVVFIPLAEETGLIGAIGEWVFATACEQAAAWARKGMPPLRVAVNLSARQLYSPGFLDTVRRILVESGVQAGAMEMEITESVMMQDVEQVAAVLGELQTLGVHVAVDDFGTGYSSLAYLKRLPLDSLKVDRSFIRDVPGDADDESITRAVVALAHSLRLKVVAEGVETEAQLTFLRELGCDEIQGFLFSRPVPAAEFEELVRRDQRLPAGGARDAA